MAGPRRTLTHLASQIDWSMPPIRNTRSHSRMEEWGRWGAPGVELWGIEGECAGLVAAISYDISRAYTPAALGTTAPSGGYIPAQRVATVYRGIAALSTVAKSSLGSAIENADAIATDAAVRQRTSNRMRDMRAPATSTPPRRGNASIASRLLPWA
ncbi:hypothetical protein BD779DRAFT_1478996 [Infundibulicybe gibba]|nr:hypothetical protein BD779DRAFT_1478996 [Infundibulicybe gibba]